MGFLKQNTAAVIPFGPLVDAADGVTPDEGQATALDHGTTGIMLSKNGGALAVRHATVTATTYDKRAHYLVTLDTTDTNTAGTLRVEYSDAANICPVWKDYMVLSEAAWDFLFGTAPANANLTHVMGAALTETDDGYLAAAFVKLLDVATPRSTVNELPNLTDLNNRVAQLVAQNIIGKAGPLLDVAVNWGGATPPPGWAIRVRCVGLETYDAEGKIDLEASPNTALLATLNGSGLTIEVEPGNDAPICVETSSGCPPCTVTLTHENGALTETFTFYCPHGGWYLLLPDGSTWQWLGYQQPSYQPVAKPTLAQIEASTVLAKEATVAAAGVALNAAGVRGALGMASANLDTQLSGISGGGGGGVPQADFFTEG